MGKIVIEGQNMTLQYSSPRFYWSIGDLTWRTCWVVCNSLGRSLVSCQPSRCRCCCTMPKRSPAKRDWRDNGERKIKKSKESASSSTSKVDEDLVGSFFLCSVMAPLFTFSRIMHLSMVSPRMGGPGNPRELDFVKCTWVGILTSTTVPSRVGNLTRPPSWKVERTWEWVSGPPSWKIPRSHLSEFPASKEGWTKRKEYRVAFF